ncbi:iroquois-class homeodomain protein IRX-5-like, partial [Plectropomus leopardus]|uniref:iroquois-class homeodomain protein IRX-5-like n=1 Tax=Plectropomus leopardus TaxID=160734 RepID=UPI001C4D76F9
VAPRLPASVGPSCVLAYRDDSGSDTDRSFTDPDFKDSGDPRRPLLPTSAGAPPHNAPQGTVRAAEPQRPSSPPSKERIDSCNAIQGPNPAPKPKLWSLAEIATSSDRNKACSDSSQGGGAPARTPFPHSPALPRHLYYTSPFMPGYSSYGHLGPLHGGPASHLNGLQQTMLQRAEALARDCRLRGQGPLDLHELKKGMTNA